ncbi:hypothetical protein E4U42_004994 [Claviceps africana]|uniref:Autophagy-related protein 29 n=1 Tax=Claviceps africana TaxID=83212 RepID=A0A8K0J5D4_9HYPO|nr:hypothetical protein E4U42_004994 [Claviceps africana]
MPQVHWDPTKDEALWKILSDAAQKQIDWSQVYDDMADIHDDSQPPSSIETHTADTRHSCRAAQFDVPVDFLSQQVAYLTERHASQVRAQVRKATAAAKGSAMPSPVSGSEPTAAVYPRTGSALSARRDSPMPRQDANASATPATTLPARPDMSRHASLNTTLKDGSGASHRHVTSFPNRALDQAPRRRLSSLPITSEAAKPLDTQADGRSGGGTSSPGPAESSSDESSSSESSPAQSRIIRRPPRFQQQQQQDTPDKYRDDDGDDESEPAFQPFQAPSDQQGQDMASTLRGDEAAAWRRAPKTSRRPVIHQSQTSDDSSTGSSPVVAQQQSREPLKASTSLLSPRRNAEPAGRSLSREGSEGTPSMGSSFSDLDDASITQSALEEALASHMNRPGASSRFSISQAFRSRYHSGSH